MPWLAASNGTGGIFNSTCFGELLAKLGDDAQKACPDFFRVKQKGNNSREEPKGKKRREGTTEARERKGRAREKGKKTNEKTKERKRNKSLKGREKWERKGKSKEE